jgi:DNA recombination protein RmuC
MIEGFIGHGCRRVKVEGLRGRGAPYRGPRFQIALGVGHGIADNRPAVRNRMTVVAWASLSFLFGSVVGAVVGMALMRRWMRAQAPDPSALLGEIKTTFAALSREALAGNTDDFIKLAHQRLEYQTAQGEQVLETKKKLIDAQLESMGKELTELNRLIQDEKAKRGEMQGTVVGRIQGLTKAAESLQSTTDKLREALANPQRRGQWGERMAEDVLRLAGMIEGVNYRKQQGSEGGRPDFTFPLPSGQVVHMDVKFPLANYLKVLDAADDASRSVPTAAFLKDVRSRIKEITGRAYVDPAAGTIDCVLVFIPNEQVYGFIHEKDPELLDDALRHKVVLCSPLTLYAVLAVLRQSVDAFRMQQASRQILELLAEFKKEWTNVGDVISRLGKKLEDAFKEFNNLAGVRTNKLERQLERIEGLRSGRDAEVVALAKGVGPLASEVVQP